MNRITENGGNAVTPDLRLQNVDLYIRYCTDCAKTCRTWAENFTGGAGRLAAVVASCLNCARACEVLSNAFLLQKQGIRTVNQLQIDACIHACRAHVNECDKKSYNYDGLSVCADVTRKCEEMLRVLLRNTSSKSGGFKGFNLLRNFKVFRTVK